MNLGLAFFDNLIHPSGWFVSRKKLNLGKAFGWQDGLLPPSKVKNENGARTSRRWTFLPLYLSLVFIFVFFTARLFKLQVIQGVKNFRLSEENRIRIQLIRAERGVIYDRNGEILARNAPGFRVAVEVEGHPSTPPSARGRSGSPLRFEKLDVGGLARLLGISEDGIWERIHEAEGEGKSQVTVATGVDYDKALQVENHLAQLPGVLVEVDPVRDYPSGEEFAHVLGYVGEIDAEELSEKASKGYFLGDKVGKTSLESVYDEYLHGTVGKRLFEVSAVEESLREMAREEAIPGDSLRLSLDAELQKVAYEALVEQIVESGASGGAVVAQDPRTGEILALVSYPSFDPNKFSRGISAIDYAGLLSDARQPLFNRTVGGVYPPGSTFKMITATAALEEEVITPFTQIDCPGAISIGPWVFRDWKPEGHGVVSLVEAIGKSADVFFYEIGGGYGAQRGVGVVKLAEWSRLFGIGSQTRVDLTGETEGLVPDEEWKERVKGEPWYIGNTYHMSIGQGDMLTTPLQLNNVTSVVANGGQLYQPFLVKEVRDRDGELIRKFESSLLQADFVGEETLEWVRRGMRAAVEPGGTAWTLWDFRIPVAAKTGTAEAPGGGEPHAWLTAFGPYVGDLKLRPSASSGSSRELSGVSESTIAVTVLVENGGQGADVAGPVVREILEKYFEN